MSKKEKKKRTFSRSWRRIVQNTHRRPLTNVARRRRYKVVFKWVAIATLGIGLLLGMVGGIYWTSQLSFFSVSSGKVAIVFKTDGVLTQKWVERRISLPEGKGLMRLDIFAIKRELERIPQLKKVTVERFFPSTLKIFMEESCPVLRLVVKEKGEKRVLLVSTEGLIYEGVGYSEATLKALPFVAGVSIRREGTGYRKIAGIPVVATLLQKAKEKVPALYANWRVVYLDKFEGQTVGAVIKIKTENVGTLIFMPEKFDWQLDRLAYIVRYANERNICSIKQIDLSVEDHAAVKLTHSSDIRRRAPGLR